MQRSTSYRKFLWLTLGLCVTLKTAPACAYSTGITLFSGKQGSTCNTVKGCHTDLPPQAPLVRFEGPTEVPIKMMATFRFVVHSQAPAAQTYAGFNVAASAGQLTISQAQGGRVIGNEITHFSPKQNDANADATFEFTWQAPAAAGTYTLYGAGNSVNRNFLPSGDKPATATFMVKVLAAAASPTPTQTESPTPPLSTQTPSPTPRPCVADCNRNGVVTPDELLVAVQIALGGVSFDHCPTLDVDRNTVVSIEEVLTAVKSAEMGCSGP